MARLTMTLAAPVPGVATAEPAFMALEELVATLTAALATLVADGASPTQAHVTAVDNAYTAVKLVWSNDIVLDYSRVVISTDNLVNQSMRALTAKMQQVR